MQETSEPPTAPVGSLRPPAEVSCEDMWICADDVTAQPGYVLFKLKRSSGGVGYVWGAGGGGSGLLPNTQLDLNE